MPDADVKHPAPQPIVNQPSGLLRPKKAKSPRKIKRFIVGGLIALLVFLGGVVAWYNYQLSPVGSDINQLEVVTIVSGSTPSQIAHQLKTQSVIRSETAFDIYTRISGKNNSLQAGTYRLSPAESTAQIVEHLVKGSVDQFSITFYPGATLVDNSSSTKKYDVTTVLKKAGYSDQQISAAFKKTYTSPLFIGKPASADLEGYVYGETYKFNTGATVEDILQATFAEYYQVVQDSHLIDAFTKHGLTLYQGITLASIIQREASGVADQKQVAQVFYSRLKIGMQLGSDVTYQYIADKTGVARDPNLNSPYNTRRFAGLPPGPIATPGLGALIAVAQPADGDYLFFLSGDDDVTYFAKTSAEHEANIVNHCKVKCSAL